MNYLLLILFGLAPSVVWLLYFLRKDVHPEDNSQVIKIFGYGILSALPTALIQLGILDLLSPWKNGLWKIIFILIFSVALIEEFMKYLVVKNKVLKSSHFDEAVDLPLYMIISALGFAAAENILIIANAGKMVAIGANSFLIASAGQMAVLGFCRFISATFLHALSSGTLGIFLALAICQTKNKIRTIMTGFALAIFLHALYNFSIMKIENNFRFIIPIAILINLAVVLSLGFKKLAKFKSICQAY
ncbi:MAG: PrsW family glutamic-type intramembrane protease [bacterium]|nr:PrsW family glutamic-type intramembrane protease [bacterium]